MHQPGYALLQGVVALAQRTTDKAVWSRDSGLLQYFSLAEHSSRRWRRSRRARVQPASYCVPEELRKRKKERKRERDDTDDTDRLSELHCEHFKYVLKYIQEIQDSCVVSAEIRIK